MQPPPDISNMMGQMMNVQVLNGMLSKPDTATDDEKRVIL
jgi:hypothetical protein